MKQIKSILLFPLLVILLTCCQKDDRLRPDCTNPFFGLYNPAAHVKSMYHVIPNDGTDNDSIPCLSMQWLGLRLISVANEGNIEKYQYDQHNRLASIDSSIFFTYNSDNLLSSIKIYNDSTTRTLLFQYDGQLIPSKVVDSCFLHSSQDPTDWYSTSHAYRLEWEKLNLTKAIPTDENEVRYEYSYDSNHNPFAGLAWSLILKQPNILEFPNFFSHNNVKEIVGYKPDSSIQYHCLYTYDYRNGWPSVIRRQNLTTDADSVSIYTLNY